MKHHPSTPSKRGAVAESFVPANCAAWAPLGEALLRAPDHDKVTVRHADGRTQPLTLRDLRRLDGFPASEELALDLARGTVLDLGCGAGCHSAALWRRGETCLAVDRSLPALISSQGSAAQSDGRAASRVWQVAGQSASLAAGRFDTILLLMNGLGLCQTIARAPAFLDAMRRLLRPEGGQILVESCDLEQTDSSEERRLIAQRRAAGRHPGESRQQLSWGGLVGEPFTWLYLSSTDLAKVAARSGLHAQVVYLEPDGCYLARLAPATP